MTNKNLLSTSQMARVKGGLEASTTTTTTSAADDDKRRERPGGGVSTQ